MTDINTIETVDTLNIGGVKLSGIQSNFSTNMYEAMVQAAQNKSGIDLGNSIKVQEGVWNKELLLECKIEKLDTLISGIQDKFHFVSNIYNSLPVDTVRQVGEYIGSFECEGKGYIILFPRNGLTDEIIPERGIYKGVIVNPELYFSDEAQKQVEDGVKKTGKILNGE